MILRSIRLEDFGLYAGISELDLVPRRRQGGPSPIVLIGGKNGTGKTTLLEAVRVSLYGRRALGARVGQGEYDNYLRDRINRDAATQSAAVTLEFDYAEAGTIHRYRVRREWAVRGKSVVETLLLEKDGATITSVPRDEWHQFLQELIPPGVSQLFFFDGEKISEIADGEHDNEQLGEAVRGLLGIDLVGRLRIDLGLYLGRHQREDGAGDAERLESLNRDISLAERRAGEIRDGIAELTSQRESQARAAEHIRRQFIASGGDAAAQRAKTEAEQAELKRAMARAEHELRGLGNTLLPFAMAPKLIRSFRDALVHKDGGQSAAQWNATLHNHIDEWRSSQVPGRKAKWSAKHWADLESFFAARMSASSDSRMIPALREIGDGATTLARLVDVDTIIRPRALALLDEMEALTSRSIELESVLVRADNAASGVLLDELRISEQRLGATEAKLLAREQELKTLRGQIVTLVREQKRLLDEQAQSIKAAGQAALAGRTAQALADYEQRLLNHKLKQLRGEFVRCFNYLARKGEIIKDVQIDPVTFVAVLIDKTGSELPKVTLSAGEKQIYAIAMLWALARTSGRPLPMIIDTPLARLDSEHRAKLVHRYFPAASHQVILLSTDTEIDEDLKEELGASVSHSYRLDYGLDTGRTTVSYGYFDGDVTMRERQHALRQA